MGNNRTLNSIYLQYTLQKKFALWSRNMLLFTRYGDEFGLSEEIDEALLVVMPDISYLHTDRVTDDSDLICLIEQKNILYGLYLLLD